MGWIGFLLSFGWAILACLAVLLVGGVLIRRGRRRVRDGRDPHCIRCEYNLRGVMSWHCPECGGRLNPHTVAIGRGRRRPGWAIAGALVILIGVSMIVWSARFQVRWFNWNSLKPVDLLLQETLSGSAGSFRLIQAAYATSDRLDAAQKRLLTTKR
jgi:hypothetical protein